MKTAMISGVTGQDGSYLSDILLKESSEQYRVIGLIRRTATDNKQNIRHLLDNPNFILEYADLADAGSIVRLVQKYKPDEFYNLAAQSHVRVSFDNPEYTMDVTGTGALRVLDALYRYSPDTRYYQASSSEMFGKVAESPQNEATPLHPRSPYGIAKLSAHWATVNYREAYGMHATSGILFNHESERRGVEFVTRKITYNVASLIAGKISKITLGNLDAKRDWGHAKEYMEAAHLMLQQDEPDTYVIGTGRTISVKDFVKIAFDLVGRNWEKYVDYEESLTRPSEVDLLQADYSKAKEKLGWEPKIQVEDLIERMLKHDLKLLTGSDKLRRGRI
jgi:GDPmannose 4,6-dehydratase